MLNVQTRGAGSYTAGLKSKTMVINGIEVTTSIGYWADALRQVLLPFIDRSKYMCNSKSDLQSMCALSQANGGFHDHQAGFPSEAAMQCSPSHDMIERQREMLLLITSGAVPAQP